jgi:hypothetical protein
VLDLSVEFYPWIIQGISDYHVGIEWHYEENLRGKVVGAEAHIFKPKEHAQAQHNSQGQTYYTGCHGGHSKEIFPLLLIPVKVVSMKKEKDHENGKCSKVEDGDTPLVL